MNAKLFFSSIEDGIAAKSSQYITGVVLICKQSKSENGRHNQLVITDNTDELAIAIKI